MFIQHLLSIGSRVSWEGEVELGRYQAVFEWERRKHPECAEWSQPMELDWTSCCTDPVRVIKLMFSGHKCLPS